jgi:outer membrane receptor protein involved in Fe transport
MNFLRKSALSSATCLQSAALAAALIGLVTATAAQAQTATPADSAEADSAAADEAERTIVVTGSRIQLPNLQSKEPTVTVDSTYIEDRGLTNIADALNEIPGYRGSVTPNGAQATFGQGVNFINTYGLGSNRTLTLLNGRRVVSSNVTTIFGNASPGTQVDLNTIPVILVDRIDRVSVGGAPVYGTDAIAGTVNIILKKRFNGLEVRATTALTGRGDNFRWNITGAGGTNFADGRGNITAAFSYEKVDGVVGNQRGFFRNNLGNTTNPCVTVNAPFCTTTNSIGNLGPVGRTPANDGRVNPGLGYNDTATDGFPGTVLVRNLTIPSLSRGGLISSGSARFNFQFDPNGNLVPYDRGIPYVGLVTQTGAARASGGDGFTFNDFIQLTSDVERINANLFGSFQLTDNVRVFAEGMFFQGKGDELVQQPTFNSTLFGGASAPLTFRVDDPRLTAQARDVLAANGYTTTFQLSRANTDLADLTGSSKNNLYRGVFGFDGDFSIGGRDFNFEVSSNYGRNDFTDYGQQVDQQKFVNAINNCGTTQIVTGTPTAPVADAACQPLDIFGEGRRSQAALGYILTDVVTKTRLEQFVFNANVGGSLFDLFGNPVGFNLGYEHHEEKGAFSPDPFLVAGLGRSVAIAPTSGKYNLDEFFGEVLIPIISPRNEFIFSKLEVFGRYRHTNNSINGGFNSYAYGGSFAPIPDIEFRGNFTRSFRTPAIVELFSPTTNIFTTVPDLCSTANRNSGPVAATRNANCTAFLAEFPNATPLVAASATVPGLSGGNPNLLNEQADSITAGVILRPRFIPGLSVSVDYLDIDLNKPISSLTVAQIAAACFDNSTFDTSDTANANSFCSLIRRDASGQVIADAQNPGVVSGFVNGNRLRVKAWQGTLDYETKLAGLGIPGDLEFAADVFLLTHRVNDITGVAPARSDGILGDPKWQGQLRIRYDNDRWGFSTHVNYIGKQLTSRFDRGPNPNDTREFDHYDPFTTVDAAIWFETADKFRMTLSITNMFDRIGQKYFGYYVPASINDSFGRRFALTVGKRY